MEPGRRPGGLTELGAGVAGEVVNATMESDRVRWADIARGAGCTSGHLPAMEPGLVGRADPASGR